MKSEDDELVNLSLNGDREAFSALISRYQQIVYTIALKRTGDYGQAQDIAQEAFLEAYLHLESLRAFTMLSARFTLKRANLIQQSR